MRNMSFMLTPDQILNQTKTVTRRLGWATLKPGTLVRAVRKCQGLKKGEKIEALAVLRHREAYGPSPIRNRRLIMSPHDIEIIFGIAATMLVGFRMGQEWERVFSGKSDCPFGSKCVRCNPGTMLAKTHIRYTSNSTWMWDALEHIT